MAQPLKMMIGLGVLAALPAYAATDLKVECVTRDLPAGAHVWMQVQPQYHQEALPPGAREPKATQAAQGDGLWEVEVPQGGSMAPVVRDFSFPVDLDRASKDRIGLIHLGVHFRVDLPGVKERPGYGVVHEATFGMPVPTGTAPLTRCIRIRETNDMLRIESAPDCQDSSFGKRTRNHPQ